MSVPKQQFWCYFILLVFSEVANARQITHPDFETETVREVALLSKAAAIANFIDTEANPCDDFYRYACGCWQAIYPARVYDGKTSVFNVLNKAYNRRVLHLMRDPKSSIESGMERKVKYFFESCLNNGESRGSYRQKVLSLVEEFGGMPALKGKNWRADKFDWLEVVALILRKYGKQIMIGTHIIADLSNNEVNRLYLGQLDELVTVRASDYYAGLVAVRRREMQTILGMSMELASRTAMEIVEFERRLAEGKLDENRGLGMEDKAQLTLLESLTDNYKPTLNFTHFVNVWLGHPYVLPVYAYVESYLDNLRKVVEDTPKEVIANYIMLQLLRDFRMEDKYPNLCVERTKHFFVKYLDHLVYRHLTAHNQNLNSKLQSLWLEIKKSFTDILNSEDTDWMTVTTRDKALEKLSAMTMEINSYETENFEQLYGDLVIVTDNYFDNVVNTLEVNGRNYRLRLMEPPKLDEADTLSFTPAYAPEYNKVIIPVSHLQPHYFWHDAYPQTLMYSTVGWMLAHELAHGFDSIGRKYDAKGNLNNWWDRNSTEEFVKRKECFKQQYSEYRYNERKLARTNAQDENIADNVAVHIAYYAFEQWLLQHQDEPTFLKQESLPNMNVTPQQLFFLSLAQVWCADVYRGWRQNMLAIDVHAPQEVRVIGMLSNFDEFAKEFKCKPNARMNPKRKCVIY